MPNPLTDLFPATPAALEPNGLLHARMFHIVALILLIGLPIAAIDLYLAGRLPSMLVATLAIPIVLGLRTLAKRGQLQAARTILAWLYTLLLIIGMLLGDGIHDATVVLLGAAMVVGSLLLERRAYFVLASFAVGMCALIGVAELSGWFRSNYSELLTGHRVFFVCVTLLLTAIPVRALVEALERSLSTLEAKKIKLAQNELELKQQKAAIGHLEVRFAKIFHAMPDPTIISRVDDGCFVEVNQAWVLAFGYSREDCINEARLELDIWVNPSNRTRLIGLIRSGQPVRRFETRLRKRSGEVALVQLSADIIELEGVEHLLMPLSEVTDLKIAEQRIRQLATRDALTGLPNRLSLIERLNRAVPQAHRANTLLAVLFVDLDRFKNINDSLGHSVGDAFLRAVAERLSALMRAGDTLARLGGDEFVALLENGVTSSEAAATAAQRILNALQQPFLIEGHSLSRSASVGISMYPADGAEPAMLIRNADTAMYYAKEAGRGVYRFFSEFMNERVQHRLNLENGLRQALVDEQFEMVYQPKVNIRSGEVTGFEALLRWRHPQLGLIAPGQFIEIAEETGLIVPIGRWVFQRVCAQIALWQAQGLKQPVAVNLSVRQFNSQLSADVAEALRASAIDPALIELEITESLFMHDTAEISAVLEALCALGVKLALDDFGTGFSSLVSLKRFLVHSLKVDRSFICDIESNPQDVAIVRAVIEMARSLGVRVVAEGVEGEAQLDVLRQLDCDEYQGYLFAHPMSAAEIEARFGGGKSA